MTLKLMYITNNPEIAKIAEKSGVEWIFVDLEVNGKEERQANLDTVKSKHSISDIAKVNEVLTKSELLVRINPVYGKTENEIGKVIDAGAEIIMLPYFKTAAEVESFVEMVNGRAKTMLLLETPEAVEEIDDILNVEGIDYIHIGINDLHLGYGMSFMFELLADGTIEKLGNKILNKEIPYGFGGIAKIGEGDLPAENIITEHYRLGSSMAILSRSFCNVDKMDNLEEIENTFGEGVRDIRGFESNLLNQSEDYFLKNKNDTIEVINKISDKSYQI